MSDAIKITITVKFANGDSEPRASASVIDLPATEVAPATAPLGAVGDCFDSLFPRLPAPLGAVRRALPPPRRRRLTPIIFDGALIAGALTTCWWLLS